LALPLATLVLFRATILGQNDLIEYQNNTVAKLLDSSRHGLIIQKSITTSMSFGQWTISPLIPLLLLIIVRGLDRRTIRNFGWMTGKAPLGIVLAGFYVVYLVTPMDLTWHLDSSLNRLMLQLWPSALLLAGLLCRGNSGSPDKDA